MPDSYFGPSQTRCQRPQNDSRLGSVARLTAIVAVILCGWLATAAPASAHGGGETEEGYLLVQQALGHLAHDSSMGGIDVAMEKVQDALDTEDQEGVDVAELEQGMAALEAGNVTEARSLLQSSIKQALDALPPATGNQTGTTTITPALPAGQGGMPRTGSSCLDRWWRWFSGCG